MKKGALLVVLLCAIGLSSCHKQEARIRPFLRDQDRANLHLIPLPTEYRTSKGSFVLSQGLHPIIEGPGSALVVSAVNRFESRLEKMGLGHLRGNTSSNLIITCLEESAGIPYLEMDESYELSIDDKQIKLVAPKYAGIEHGLQTLTSLLMQSKDHGELQCLRIRDVPRFPWRGLMIDVSRHWIPKKVILRNIDAMSAFKLNVLHLHLSDDQGFRVESKIYPRLHQVGSDGHYFSQADIVEIVNYAAMRGIRVVPEFDLPGHVSSWLAAYPELGSSGLSHSIQKSYGIFSGVLNPAKRETFQFIAALFQEMSSLFPDEYFHVGGDEVLLDQWRADEDITSFMEEKGIRKHSDLRILFAANCRVILERLGKKMVGWDELIHPEWVGPNSVVQAWRGHDELYKAVNTGFDALSSTGWYLNHNTSMEDLYRVDAVEFPGMITIEPDSARWSAYSVSARMQNDPVEGLVYFFGPKFQRRGLIIAFDQVRAFEQVSYDGDEIQFSVSSLVGKVNIRAVAQGDSISGHASSLIGRYAFSGKKIGGNDFEGGIPFPAYKKARPLSEEEKKRILGGEACIWTEWLDSLSIESRIWPRLVAPAERLWSPLEHVSDVDDLYRRSVFQDDIIQLAGVNYQSRHRSIVDSLAGPQLAPSLSSFIRQLEEVKYFERFTYFPNHDIESPLDGVADAAFPESRSARQFELHVKAYLDDPGDENVLEEIMNFLDQWIPLYGSLKVLFQTQPKLAKVEFLCLVLSDLSKIAKLKINGGSLSPEEQRYYLRIREEATVPRDAVLLAPANSLIALIDRFMIEI